MPQTDAQKTAIKNYRKKTKQVTFRITPQELSTVNMPEYPATEAKKIFLEKFAKTT